MEPHNAQAILKDRKWNELALIELREQLAAQLRNWSHFHDMMVSIRFDEEVRTHVEVEIEEERLLRIEGYLPARTQVI